VSPLLERELNMIISYIDIAAIKNSKVNTSDLGEVPDLRLIEQFG